MPKFPFYKQYDAMDCGPTCLRMIAKHYGKHFSLQTLRDKSYIDREGVSLMGISDAAESIGMHSLAVKLNYKRLYEEVPLPCIAHWKQKHFVVVYKIKKDKVYVADPGFGLVTYTKEEFLKGWLSTTNKGDDEGILLLLEPTPDFHQNEEEPVNKKSFRFLFEYAKNYKSLLWQLLLGLGLGSMLQLVFPFLTQAIVDVGINKQNFSFIVLMLIAQLMLFGGRTAVEIIRSWILLHISARINISLISDFLVKLMKLPISFFDTKMIGDLMQRIGDHRRIESFFTNASLTTLFSLFNIVIFGIVLAIYSTPIILIFASFTTLHFIWILFFLKKRRVLDFKLFDKLSANQSSLIQLITGMQEIKLNNYEKLKRWEWERIQAGLFKVKIASLRLEQWQQVGASTLNELKNILITFFAASAVLHDGMTLGEMMAISYIIGQLNGPITQIINFIKQMQDAGISLERLGEIHDREDEAQKDANSVSILPEKRDMTLEKLSFQYGGPHSAMVLKDIDLVVPQGKITALVGTSGSGKTTLVKLMLKFYEPSKGSLRLGEMNLRNIENRTWRQKCGVVMQDGFIFSDTIARNIAVSDEIIDKRRLLRAVKIANIQPFVESLPLSYNTKIGQEGIGLSGGQKQRLLIARAVYKNPEFLFFDEATNALDAQNEKIIMENLNEFFKGKTVVTVAHRLSTVQNADQIIVLEKGEIIERGTHRELVSLKGAYYRLVKNQLELGG